MMSRKLHTAILPLFYCHRDTAQGENERDRRRFRFRLDALGITYKSVYVGIDGTVCLNLSGTIIFDLSLLAELPVTHLCLQGCYRIVDFSPLHDMNLVWLNLCRTRIKDLALLRGPSLLHLDLHRTRVADLSPLKNMPMKSLDIRFTEITDVSPLRHVPLEKLSFYPSRITRGLRSLRRISTLVTVNRRPVEEFWRRHS